MCDNCDIPVVSEALHASVKKWSGDVTTNDLFNITKITVDSIVPIGELLLQVKLTFDVQKAVCHENDRNDLVGCQLESPQDTKAATCTSQVMFEAGEIQSVTVECSEPTTVRPTPTPSTTSTPTSLLTATSSKTPTSTATSTISSLKSSHSSEETWRTF
ncbi:mucin-2-like isoform X2 [Rhincodon typus]|uniref:mucin-2-like isoform X2 n=1 Tax=Rhincodon typus TaxID=259920 RepID=UPI00202E64D3|nr:mucin-2-like isoform X2 [Rhincodon typus]